MAGLTLFVLKAAATEGLFSDETAKIISAIDELPTWEANEFAAGAVGRDNVMKRVLSNEKDAENCRYIIDALIDRAARLVAASLSAVVLKSGKGKSTESPILITVEGTTFYKLHDFRNRFESYFNEYLSDDRKRYVEFTEVAQSSLIGAALAALID